MKRAGAGGWGVKDKGGEMGVGRDLFIGPENVRTEFYLPASHIATTTIAQVFCFWCLVLFLWLPSFLLTDCQLFETKAVKPKSGNGQFRLLQLNDENQQKFLNKLRHRIVLI